MGLLAQAGLFAATPEQKIYPSPAAALVVQDAYALFEFLGKMLGKAMYEVGGTLYAWSRSPLQSLPLDFLDGCCSWDASDAASMPASAVQSQLHAPSFLASFQAWPPLMSPASKGAPAGCWVHDHCP